MIHLRRLGPAFIRHVEAYGQLAGAALHDAGARVRTRATLLAVGAVLALSLVILLGATLIAAGWASPYRYWIAAGVLAVYAAAAAGCFSSALAKLPPSTHVQALKDEWQKDKDWLSSRGRDDSSTGARAAPTAAFPGNTRSSLGPADSVGSSARERSMSERV